MLDDTLTIVPYANGSGDPADYYSHGHEPATRFRAAVASHVREEEGRPPGESLDVEIAQALHDATIRHQYWKTIPEEASRWGEEEYRRVPKGTRGSYPVAVMEVSW